MNENEKQQQSDTSVKNKSFKEIKIFCNKHFFIYKNGEQKYKKIE